MLQEEGSFVGLVNQGATCYMNSLVQQLYHIPAFSSGLLSISSGTANDNNTLLNGSFDTSESVNKDREMTRTSSSGGIVQSHGQGISTDIGITEGGSEGIAVANMKAGPTDDEKFLFQLQVMFGYLRLSEKRFYDTLSFCKVSISNNDLNSLMTFSRCFF
jgi:hypothetical protein